MTRSIEELPASARAWVYTANRDLTAEEIQNTNEVLKRFTDQWVSHQIPVPAFAQIYENRFLVIMADESQHGVSGCSTDASVNLVKLLGQQLDIDFFDRWIFVYHQNGNSTAVNKEEMQQQLNEGVISKETLFFDGLIKTKDQFQNQWKVPLKDSWIARIID